MRRKVSSFCRAEAQTYRIYFSIWMPRRGTGQSRHSLPILKIRGRGLYEIYVNQAGMVTEVKILKASGDSTFDKETVESPLSMALAQWTKDNRITARVCHDTRQLPCLDSVGAISTAL